MSVLWIVIIGYAVLSTILVVGLSLWWRVMEAQERGSFSNLVATKMLWWRLMGRQEHETFSNLKVDLEALVTVANEKLKEAQEQYPEKKPEDAIIAVLSELPFPLQKYAGNVKERGQIEKFMIEVVTELKNREGPEPP